MPPLKSIAIPVKKPKASHAKRKKGALQPAAAANLVLPVELRRPTAPTPVRAQPAHRFRIGERLTMTHGGRTLARIAATCIVVARLPYEGHGSLLYRVRSDTEQYERVVAEMDLSRPVAEEP